MGGGAPGYRPLIESFVAGRLAADAFAARYTALFAAEDYLIGEPYAALAALFAKVDSYASGAADRLETEDTLRAAAAATLARLNGENTT